MLYIKYKAQTPDEHAVGLRGKPPLSRNEAMEFIYSTPQMTSFWNWGVEYPIGLLFFDDEGNLFQKEKLKANELNLKFSKLPVSVVLEIPAQDLNKYKLGQTLNKIKHGSDKESKYSDSDSDEKSAGLHLPEDSEFNII